MVVMVHMHPVITILTRDSTCLRVVLRLRLASIIRVHVTLSLRGRPIHVLGGCWCHHSLGLIISTLRDALPSLICSWLLLHFLLLFLKLFEGVHRKDDRINLTHKRMLLMLFWNRKHR